LFDLMDLPDIDLCDAILRLRDNTLRAIVTSMSKFESGASHDYLSKFQTVTSKLCQQDSKEADDGSDSQITPSSTHAMQ
jgi:hypothetical protein